MLENIQSSVKKNLPAMIRYNMTGMRRIAFESDPVEEMVIQMSRKTDDRAKEKSRQFGEKLPKR